VATFLQQRAVLVAMTELAGLLDARPSDRVPHGYLAVRKIDSGIVSVGWWQKLVFPSDRPGDRFQSGEVWIQPIRLDTARPLQGRAIGQKDRRFQQHVAKSELPEPDDSRCPPPICNGLRVGPASGVLGQHRCRER
jgi:hypothetical protein